MPAATHPTGPAPRANIVAGALLIGVALLTVAIMAHHPTVGPTTDPATALQRVAALSRPSAAVHGALIALMLLTLHGLSEFGLVRGFRRPLIRGGAVAYAAGVLVMIGAALVSGLVTTDVASMLSRDLPTDPRTGRQLLAFCGIVNQACARFGVVAMSVGIGLWSLDLLRDCGRDRLVGAFGCIVCAGPVAALALGAIRLDVHGMLDVVLLQAAWNLAIAGLLLRAR